MDNPQIIVESIKGLWGVVGIIVGGLVSWIGWYIKARHDKKIQDAKNKLEQEKLKAAEAQLEQEYRDSQIERTLKLDQKLDRMIEWQADFAKDQNQRLKVISEGLDLSMEDDKLIFQAFRKSKLLNGDSEAQSKKLEEYRKSLMKSSYLFDDDSTEIQELENLTK